MEDAALAAGDLSPPLQEPPRAATFPLGQALSPDRVGELMRGRYCRLIGILGAPNAGKTAALVSLYLLLARNKLSGFVFRNSRSLMAFDDISQGARRWKDGQLPEQMTLHTELPDERSAGFMHLRVAPATGAPVDLLMPDLPGEWSTGMIDSDRVDRLEFLKRADVVWIMVDGVDLSAVSTRKVAVRRTKLLMQRLVNLVSPPPQVILVVTRRDMGEPDQAALDALTAEAKDHGFPFEICLIASFAEGDGVLPGTGIAELVAASARPAKAGAVFWDDADVRSSAPRAMMRYRNMEPAQ